MGIFSTTYIGECILTWRERNGAETKQVAKKNKYFTKEKQPVNHKPTKKNFERPNTYLEIGVLPKEVKILTNPYVRYTRKGYLPCCEVQYNGERIILYLTAFSLGIQLFELSKKFDLHIKGMKVIINRESADKFAMYEVKFVSHDSESWKL